MNDLISRQAAIDAIDRYYKDKRYITRSRTILSAICRDMKSTMDSLPSAQPEQRWIPCSEETGVGYPEEDGFYYVTEQNYGFYLDADCKQRVTHTSHFKNGDFTDRFYTENNSNITAWMPLPEPYREERTEE